ncbi:hypothetical protein TRIP_C30085 [Candidatus Zixiibacteriota bacterium]|nr:hypothetical protein TRIP_C30085 [candidate division Zixibacteria bacterium]
MKYIRPILTGIIIIAILSGCTRKFHLRRSEEIPSSPWPFTRMDPESRANIKSSFKGLLNLKWEKKVSDRPIGYLTLGGGELIYSGSRGRVYFFDPATGKYRGRYKSRSSIQTGLTVVDSLAYFGQAPPVERFVALNLHNQKILWSRPLKDITGAPIIIENRLFLAADTGTVLCLNRESGNLVWKAEADGRSTAGPSYGDGSVYLPSDKGIIQAFNAVSGEEIFKVKLNQPLMSKAAVDDRIYISGAGGGFFSLDKKTGAIGWQREFSWPIWTTPAVDSEKVYIGDNGGILHALDKSDGHTIWEFMTNGVIVASPIIVGNYVICASLDRSIYCINKTTGLMVSKRTMKHEIRFPAISDGERIFVGAHDGTIQSFGD